MKDSPLFFGVLILIVVLSVMSAEKKNENPSAATTLTETEDTIAPAYSEATPPPSEKKVTQKPEKQRTPAEIERDIARIYKELDALTEDVRAAKLREPASPYRDAVSFRRGNVGTEDPEREYLILQADKQNTRGIDISHWHIESYITGKRAFIPVGDRLIEKWRSPVSEQIILEPGELAYLITGSSPIDISFRENLCTGYLAAEGTFYPSLRKQCPSPKSELERYNPVDLDADACYSYIQRLGRCVTPIEETYTRSKVGGACSVFIDTTFNYNDCVRLHRYDPFFGKDGTWRVYLSEHRELWRQKREIIRLLDEHDQVISVIEY